MRGSRRVLATVCTQFACPPRVDNEEIEQKPSITAGTILAFAKKEHKQAYTERGRYTYAGTEPKKAKGDIRDIRYTSSSEAIATIDNTGIVTFVTAGTVIIIATKPIHALHHHKARNKSRTCSGNKRRNGAHGNEVDLNYIDTSAITTMSYLFSNHTTHGNGLSAFNGDISKWDVSKVTDMRGMFRNAAVFNSFLSRWDVSEVTEMFGMFDGAAQFTRDLNCWADRINTVLKLNGGRIHNMFDNSGLTDNKPEWHSNTRATSPTDCPAVNPKDSAEDAS